MSVEQEILVTGIKVVDLLAPYAKGGKIGRLGVSGEGAPGTNPSAVFPSLMSNRLTFVLLSLLKPRLLI